MTPVTSSLLARYLGVEEPTPHALVSAARQVSWTLPTLVLSVLEREGVPLGSGSADELRRARARAGRYEELAAELGRCAGARVLKGPSVARHYPAGVQRPVGDLDVVVPDEPALWRAALAVARSRTVTDVMLAVVGPRTSGGPEHLVVALDWPPVEDPLLDDAESVDLSTIGYFGDLATVPPRPALPDDPVAADLLAIAEERFQRPLHCKDLVDALALAGAAADADGVLRAVVAYRLAPEVLELLDLAGRHAPLGAFAELADDLREPAGVERARRAASPLPAAPDAAGAVDERLAAGHPVHGFRLRDAPPGRRLDRARFEEFDGGLLLLTPLGDFLLVGSGVVPRDLHARALAALDLLPVEGPEVDSAG